MGEREKFRLTQALYSAAGQLGTAFENEIGLLPAVFGQEREDIERNLSSGDWNDFAKRWEVWKKYAIDSTFLSGIYVIRPGRRTRAPGTWTWNTKTFVPESDEDLIKTLHGTVTLSGRGRPFVEPADLGDGTEAFLIPAGWTGEYWLAIRIDQKALSERLIPLLAEKYLFGKTDYLFRIVDERDKSTVYLSDKKVKESAFNHKDIAIPIIRADFRSVRVSEAQPPEPAVEKEPGLAIMKVRRSLMDALEDPKEADLWRGLPPPISERAPQARWTLEAVHRSGSLSGAVLSATIRSAVVSSSILVILGVVLVVLAMAVRRNQELADRRHEFVATVSHELKTPVAVIRSAAENLADGVVKEPEKTARYGDVIRRESGKLTDMIDSLLVYARLGDGVAKRFESFDLGSVVATAIESREDAIAAAGMEVESDIPGGIYVRGDPAALELAVGNVISNALKHAAEGKYIGLALRRESTENSWKKTRTEWAVLTIRDRGPGIPKKERSLIFDSFYRGEAARQRQTPGSGLGLNLVYRIITAHGGSISLDAKAERGSAFVMRLPLEVRSNA